MSSQQGSQKLRRNGSPSKSTGPLRATLPVSFMTQNVIHNHVDIAKSTVTSSTLNQVQIPRNKVNSSPTCKNNFPNTGRSRLSPWRIGQWSPTPKVEKSQTLDTVSIDCPVIRRTASLDAIYLKGQWPRGNYLQFRTKLFVDKSTQTPDDWQDDRSYRYHVRAMDSHLNREQKQKRIFNFQQLNVPSTQFSGYLPPNRVAVSTNTEYSKYRDFETGEIAHSVTRAIPVPTRNNHVSKVRNSVEGFNPEIEKLIRIGSEISSEKIQEPTPDGHRAPIAELFKSSSHRSIDTQTPVITSAQSLSNPSSPCSVSPLVLGPLENSRPPSGAMDDGEDSSVSPEDFQALSLGTSPRVSRFLCREPPDGCEKVTLKTVEHSPKIDKDFTLYCPPKPSSFFVLQPSSSSAFCPLYKLPTVRSSSSSHLYSSHCGINNEISDRASSVPPQWQITSALQATNPPCTE